MHIAPRKPILQSFNAWNGTIRNLSYPGALLFARVERRGRERKMDENENVVDENM
jgi:hypothetical protein